MLARYLMSLVADAVAPIQQELQKTREQLDGALRENAVLSAVNGTLRQQLAIAQNNFEWARERMNQVEQERGILFMRTLNVDLPVPNVARSPEVMPTSHHGTGLPMPDNPRGIMDQFGVNFEDVGDDAAAQLGIEHDDHGAVVYRK